MENKKNPDLYDHTFFPARGKNFLPIFIFGCVFLFAIFFLIRGAMAGEPVDSGLLWTMIISGLISILGGLAVWLYLRVLTVGINQDGVYIRPYGFIPWGDIKGLEIVSIWAGNHMQRFIYISLHSPDFLFERFSMFQRIGKFFTKKRVAIAGNVVSIKLEELLELLKKYHRDYKNNELQY